MGQRTVETRAVVTRDPNASRAITQARGPAKALVTDIGQTRQRIGATLDELEATVRDLLDWQAKVRQRPLIYTGIALAAGFVIAGGPKRALRHGYWLIRPSARRRAAENQYLTQLRETLDQTLGGLPTGVALQARDLRVAIAHTDPRAKKEATIVIEHKNSLAESLLIKVAEIGVTMAATTLMQRLLNETESGANKD